MSTGKLIVLSAPSGTGKTTICKGLLIKNNDWQFSISATTRNLRDGEVDGKDYIYMSNEKFELDDIFEFCIFKLSLYSFKKIDKILSFKNPPLLSSSPFT